MKEYRVSRRFSDNTKITLLLCRHTMAKEILRKHSVGSMLTVSELQSITIVAGNMSALRQMRVQ